MDVWSDSAAAGAAHGLADHLDRVYAIAQGEAGEADDEILRSWHRCVNEYRVDPASREPPRILTSTELEHLQEPLARLTAAAQDELDRLYAIVEQARYAILLCNNQGVAIDCRGSQSDLEQLKYWGTWLGSVWSEDVEGTNGVGTCIAEQHPITIHRDQHFRARHIALSCSSAPIFDGDGALIAVLDVSSSDPELSEASHALTGALAAASARAIEERFFREQFRREWIVAAAVPGEAGSAMLLAVDADQRIIGADRTARARLPGINGGARADLWTMFERDHGLFASPDRGDRSILLAPAGTGERWPALVTPPENASGGRHSREKVHFHTRPRRAVIGSRQQLAPSALARGGLSPRVLRRVHDYVEAHLEESLSLDKLAATSGLSLYHFTRAFKQSQGVTPHNYLLQRRIERAQELLIKTDAPMSQIAFATGFADQSHFARRFRQHIGVSPSAFRWSKR
jgi:AraC-like DNA-binding protein